MDTKVKGLVIKLIDYKEADKLASIFTYEQGIITAKFRGVRRDSAKMKAIAQPFTFADFTMVGTSNNKTIANANIIDNYYGIFTDYHKTMCGYIVLDMLKSILPAEKREEDLFLLTISALKNIETSDEYISTIDYILQFLSFSGVGLELVDADYVYLDTFTGDIKITKDANSTPLDKKVYRILRSIATGEQSEENTTIYKQILRMLHNIIYIRLGEDIKAFEFI
ncbi:MAG: DNA repair protein RecO [Clostridiales bacterium]|nr:DNA repair protein RecO [Clostridiales bacterium]